MSQLVSVCVYTCMCICVYCLCVCMCAYSMPWLLLLLSTPIYFPITFCSSYIWEPEYKDNEQSRTVSRTKPQHSSQELRKLRGMKVKGTPCLQEISIVSSSEYHTWALEILPPSSSFWTHNSFIVYKEKTELKLYCKRIWTWTSSTEISSQLPAKAAPPLLSYPLLSSHLCKRI